MAKLLKQEEDGGSIYRLLETEIGYLMVCRMKGEQGMIFGSVGSVEYLYRTREAAEAGFQFAMLMNGCGFAMMNDLPTKTYIDKLDEVAAAHKETTERLDDAPKMGDEVRELFGREKITSH